MRGWLERRPGGGWGNLASPSRRGAGWMSLLLVEDWLRRLGLQAAHPTKNRAGKRGNGVWPAASAGGAGGR